MVVVKVVLLWLLVVGVFAVPLTATLLLAWWRDVRQERRQEGCDA